MSQEINLSFALSVYKSSVMSQAIAKAVAGKQITMTGNLYVNQDYTVTTSITALPLGTVTSPHWAFFFNTDSTNYLEIQNSLGSPFLRLLAGESAPVPLSPSFVPYVIANTASCILEYALFTL